MDVKVANEEFARVKHAFVKEQWGAACLPASAMLCDLINARGVTCEMKRGFLILDNQCAACWHAWVDVGGKSYDIGTAVTERLTHIDFGSRVALTLPQGYERMDLDDDDEVKNEAKNNELYEMYVTKPDEFWAVAPRNVNRMRTAMLERQQRK